MRKQMIVLIKLSKYAGEVNINIEDMKKSFASAIHLPRLKHLKDTVYADQIRYLQTKNPNEFSELKRVYETSYGTTKQP
jgi:HJR/Mrr/RecB family endonuclease